MSCGYIPTRYHGRECAKNKAVAIHGHAKCSSCWAVHSRPTQTIRPRNQEILTEVAIIEGEKSLELVQALLVVSFWYRAPENYARTNQNQLASVALSIAIDIGLDRIAEPRAPEIIDDKWNRAEAQRTWLGCFLLCARYMDGP